MQVWDPATGSEVQRLQGKQPDVSSLAVCPTSPLLASSSRDGSIQLWDRRSEFGGVQAHKDTVRCVAASVDGRLVASGGWDHEIAVWDLATGRLKTQLEGHKSAVMALAFASSQEAESDAASAATLVSAGNDHTLRLWNADAGEEKHLIAQGEQFQNFTSVVMLGSTVVAGEEISQSTSHNITLWDTSTGDEAGCLSGTNGPIQSLALARNAGLLVSGCSGDNACIIIWDMASKEAKERIMCDEEVVGVTTTPAGNLLAAVFSNGNVGVWDASTCKKRLALTLSHSASALAFSPDGRSLAVGDSDASVRLLDSGTGEELMAWQGHSGSVTAVAFSPCGTRIYTGSEDQTVRVWIMPE